MQNSPIPDAPQEHLNYSPLSHCLVLFGGGNLRKLMLSWTKVIWALIIAKMTLLLKVVLKTVLLFLYYVYLSNMFSCHTSSLSLCSAPTGNVKMTRGRVYHICAWRRAFYGYLIVRFN